MPTTTDTVSGSARWVVRAQATVWSLAPAQNHAVSLLIAEADGRRPAAVSGDVTPAQLGIGR